ncbi:MAG: GNAT family N-acetyltransferase [Oscillospiraceae bacterium]|nr:GNAT family N-acetyltransferase [Oscillospiraceae bacterium]
MTIELRHPHPGEEAALRELFTEAFGDEAFTDLFFAKGYSRSRCLVAFAGELLAALHWFDCTLDGEKAAYVYGIASFKAQRGRGIGSELIRGAVEKLQELGYRRILLVPAGESLFGYYERFGFRAVSTIREMEIGAGEALPIRRLTVSEYAAARRTLLPERGLLQEGACLELLSGYAEFYAAGGAVAAVTGDMVWELLGDEAAAPGLIAALGLERAAVRMPGPGRPFAMALGGTGDCYLGLALD